MKIYKFIKPVALGILLLSSCNDDILEKSNPNQLSTETFFETTAHLEAAVNAVYAGLQTNQMYAREYFFIHDMLSDDFVMKGNLEAPRLAALSYNLDPSNSIFQAVWQGLYRIIHRANLVVANADKVSENEISQDLRERYIAEARFLRAWAYFELVSLWGAVPMLTVPAEQLEGTERTDAATIYSDVIFADLDYAEANLPLASEYSPENVGRATKGAAQALKGKIHLFRADHAAAKTELAKVIASGEYTLSGVDYNDNFIEETEFNAESIFEVQFTEAYGNGNVWSADGPGQDALTLRGQEYGSPVAGGWRNVTLSPSLLAELEGDPRIEASWYEAGDTWNNGTEVIEPGQEAPQKYSNMYKRDSENMSSGINFRVIRYADVLLMMAEAVLFTDGFDAAEPYVNEVRARVGLAPVDASSVDEMFNIIVKERRIELNQEQIRNRDIRRWRREGKLDGEPIAPYKAIHDLLPIPSTEMERNPALGPEDQNPGY